MEFNEALFFLFVDFKIAYDSVRREVYSHRIWVPLKLVRLIQMSNNGTCIQPL
jgi:hypothetical protein